MITVFTRESSDACEKVKAALTGAYLDFIEQPAPPEESVPLTRAENPNTGAVEYIRGWSAPTYLDQVRQAIGWGPAPFLVGAVGTAADLPTDPQLFAGYLVRDTLTGWCTVPNFEGWVSQDWSSGLDGYWCPADQVPNVQPFGGAS